MQVPVQLPFPLQEGQKLTPEQIKFIQQRIAEEAAQHDMPIPQYIEMRKRQQIEMMQKQQQQQQQNGQQSKPGQGQQQQQQQSQNQPNQAPRQANQEQQHTIPLDRPPPPPTPEGLAVANFLRSQDLKMRTCIYQEKRRDLFRVKRAMRALMSPEYEKARKKDSNLPDITDRISAENVFKRLPMSLLALQVEKVDPDESHGGPKPKRVKGLWTVRVVSQQEARDDTHYVWLYEGSQWKQKVYALGALCAAISIVLFPLWPLVLRQGVWYLSMGCVGLLGLFLGLTVFRLVLYCLSVLVAPRGLWLYPNLLADVGVIDSFRPFWAWEETPEERKAKRQERREKRLQRKERRANAAASTNSKTDADTATPEGHSGGCCSSHAKPEATPTVKLETKAPNAAAKKGPAPNAAAPPAKGGPKSDSGPQPTLKAYVEDDN